MNKQLCPINRVNMPPANNRKSVRYLILMSVVLLAFQNGIGGEWRPFVGLGAVVEHPVPIRFWESSAMWEPLFYAPGTNLEVGIKSRKTEWYVSYRATNTPEGTDGESSDQHTAGNGQWMFAYYYHSETASWSERRAHIGFRHRPGNESSKVNLTLGGGLSVGKSVFRKRVYEYSNITTMDTTFNIISDGVQQYRYSKTTTHYPSFGGLLELGVFIPVESFVETLLLSQLQVSWTDFEGTTDYLVITPSLNAQIRYTFGR